MSRRGEGINYYGLSTSLAAAVGPFLGILLFHGLLAMTLSSPSVVALIIPLWYRFRYHEI